MRDWGPESKRTRAPFLAEMVEISPVPSLSIRSTSWCRGSVEAVDCADRTEILGFRNLSWYYEPMRGGDPDSTRSRALLPTEKAHRQRLAFMLAWIPDIAAGGISTESIFLSCLMISLNDCAFFAKFSEMQFEIFPFLKFTKRNFFLFPFFFPFFFSLLCFQISRIIAEISQKKISICF